MARVPEIPGKNHKENESWAPDCGRVPSIGFAYIRVIRVLPLSKLGWGR